MRIIFLLFFSFLLISCNKKDDAVKIPTEVKFQYNGQEVAYGVVKRTYTKDADGNTLSSPVVKYWLDRNLGAVRSAEFPNDSLARGDLFQWGRRADGHQRRNSDTTHQLAATVVPDHGKFILGDFSNGFPRNWTTSTDENLWTLPDNKNCDCPDGWHVATIEELAMELHSWEHDNIVDSFNSTLKWVPSGTRDNNGIEYYSTYWSFMWSSTNVQGQIGVLAIIGNEQSEIFQDGTKVAGHAVRCVMN